MSASQGWASGATSPTTPPSGARRTAARHPASGSPRRSSSAASPRAWPRSPPASVSGNWDESARTPLDQLDADTIFSTLLARDVEFVVIGGLAVSAHGHPRGTKVVGLVPSPERANLRRLHAALSELGSEPLENGDFRADEPPVPFAPDALDEGGNWALRTAAGRVDVLQWIPGIDDGYDRLRSNALDVE